MVCIQHIVSISNSLAGDGTLLPDCIVFSGINKRNFHKEETDDSRISEEVSGAIRRVWAFIKRFPFIKIIKRKTGGYVE